MIRQLCIYIDVDDTLVRSAGSKRIPIPAVIKHVAELHRDGALLYCWSSGGADYARQSTEELGIAHYFTGFLPKPHVIIDDQLVAEWPQFLHVHPSSTRTLDEYRATLGWVLDGECIAELDYLHDDQPVHVFALRRITCDDEKIAFAFTLSESRDEGSGRVIFENRGFNLRIPEGVIFAYLQPDSCVRLKDWGFHDESRALALKQQSSWNP